ncbi:MAG: restriction endonuclease, partial [Candidatus Omnitrophica bacterium]|nr:restriction endonuclease [Candidatus Omnitrophota bacterium]
MKAWLVRGGKHGEQESVALENGLACIGFNDVPDLTKVSTKEAMRETIEETDPDACTARVSNSLGQLYAFAQGMEIGDLVAMPLKTQPQIALGIVTGLYQYRTDLGEIHHTRRVDWKRNDAPRTIFKEDLRYSLGAIQTVCQIKRNNAVERLLAISKGNFDPGINAPASSEICEEDMEFGDATIDIEQIARDRIREHIGSEFKGHSLSRLVDAVLRSEGYVTHLSPPGPDGGVDILARRGGVGFEGPRLCVQVKSTSSPADVTVFRGLQGTMATFQADEG